MRIIFACGGTAGHINPALALARYVEQRRPGSAILFVGAAGDSMEATLVPKAGYPLRQVNVNSFRRKLDAAGVRHNLKAAKNLWVSRRQAQAILDDFRPDAVVGTGGFASYPITREAARRGIPTAVHESNAVPGLTTRRLAKHVDKLLLGLYDPSVDYPHPERVVVTGTPVRPDFFARTRKEARQAFGLTDDKPLVAGCWGSLGASVMNAQMAEVFALCVQNGCPFHLIHASGARYYEQMLRDVAAKGVSLADHPELEVRDYIYDMALVMAAADVVLCRAGASTISELTALAKPAVLVPSPNVVGDHQTKNASLLANGGGAVLLPEGECTPRRLYATVTDLLDHPARRAEMGAALSRLSPPDAAERIYDTLRELTAARDGI